MTNEKNDSRVKGDVEQDNDEAAPNKNEKNEPDSSETDERNRGERPGNLRGRSDWFQKRHGGG